MNPTLRSIVPNTPIAEGGNFPAAEFLYKLPDYILEHGQEFAGRPLPGRYRMMAAQVCYYNAQQLARSSKVLRYVEGKCVSTEMLVRFEHAWGCSHFFPNQGLPPLAIRLHHPTGSSDPCLVLDRTAVYFCESEYVRFTKRLLFGAFQFCNSPLTNMLRDYFGERPDLYARAVLHLYDLLEGNAESLIGMSQLSAWKILSERYPKAFPEIC